jgi:hypothetical protein
VGGILEIREEVEENGTIESRVKAKLETRYGKGSGPENTPPDTLPRWTLIDNKLTAQAVQKYRREAHAEIVFEIRFNLNGYPYEVEVPVTDELINCAGQKDAAVTAIVDAVSQAITRALVHKLFSEGP